MLRKTLTILSLIGLLLSVGLWGVSHLNCSYVVVDKVGEFEIRRSRLDYSGRRSSLNVSPGGLLIFHCEDDFVILGDDDLVSSYIFPRPRKKLTNRELIAMRFGQWVGSYHQRPNSWTLRVRLWVPTILFTLLSFVTSYPLLRRRKRKKLGLCLKCGYDLRASKDRCPECGEGFSK